ncbi:MAG: PAS domain S-box protein [Candidatus Moranbacteria bacterium]|nr:PAS domain S-box protein [Candidatus Moranbacteria bacterium]
MNFVKNVFLETNRNGNNQKNLIQSKSQFVCHYLPDSTITFINSRYAKLFTKQKHDLLGKKLLDFNKKYQKKEFSNFIKNLKKTKDFVICKDRFQSKTKEDIWIEWVSFPKFDKKGNLIEIQARGRDITEKERAVEEIKDQKKFLEILIDTIPSPIFYKDEKGRYLGCNQVFADRILNSDRNNIKGKTVFDFAKRIPRKLAEVYHKKDLDLIKKGGVQVYESKVQFADRKNHDVIFNKAVFRDAKGKIKGLVGVILDITDRKQILKDLMESEKKYRMLMENAPIGIISVDLKGRIMEVNTKLLNILGSPSAKETKKINILTFPFLVKAGISQDFKKCIKTHKPVIGQRPYTSKWGKKIYFSYHIKPLYDEKNKNQMIGVEALMEDISARKKAQFMLEKSNKKYRELIEAIPYGIVEINKKGRIMFCNDRYLELLKLKSKQSCISKKLWQMAQSERIKTELKLNIQNIFDKKFNPKSFFSSFKTQKKESMELRFDWNFKKDKAGRIIGMILIVTDISEQRKSEKRLLESYKHLGVINRKLAILLNLKVDESKNKKKVYKFILTSAYEISGADYCAIYQFDKENKKFIQLIRERPVKNENDNIPSYFLIKPKTPDYLKDFVKNKVRIQGFSADYSLKMFCNQDKLKQFILLPLISKGELSGCLFFGFRKKEAFSTQDLYFFDVFCAQTANILEDFWEKNKKV